LTCQTNKKRQTAAKTCLTCQTNWATPPHVLVNTWRMELEKYNHSHIPGQSDGCKDWPSMMSQW
jgi:hypothetical protein